MQFFEVFVQCVGLQSPVVFAIICGFIMSIFRFNGCDGDCGQCEFRKEGETHSHDMPTEQCRGGLEGWKLAGSAALVFLFPILTALAGVLLYGHDADSQLGGGIAGAAAGLLVAMFIIKVLFRKRNRKNQEK